MPNRLAHESSLYLRQHANNPVDWFPWGPEALARAKAEDRPIFLSVGYSACHWCHVMEHESFEREATAAILNKDFVCVKVDREERPDLDQIYMTAHHLLNRGEGGGWPLSVFLTPDLTPFYAGTYYPPQDAYGRPGFPRLLGAIADAWANKRGELIELGQHVADHLKGMGQPAGSDGELSVELLEKAVRSLGRAFDSKNGGFGHAPKFPHPMEIKLLLRTHARTRDANALQMATHTLTQMARGGIYDQVGGGFARYSVDAVWLVPHFEKMLYDNALLPPAYADAYRVTGDPFYRQIAEEVLSGHVLREMTHPDGGFYSTLDADSEGEEGKFYVWNEAELENVLGVERARLAKAVWVTSAAGNFEGHNILFRRRSDDEDARVQGMTVEAFRAELTDLKAKLYGERTKRVWPGRDEKILTAWNGLMVAAFAHCGAAFGDARFVAAAEKAAGFVLAHLRDANGRLLRTWGEGVGAKLTAYLEDYAYMTDAVVTLYEATFDAKWLRTAGELADAMIRHYADPAGGFFFTADDHEQLLTRAKDMQDGSVPSGNAMAATALLRLAKLTGRRDYFVAAENTLKAYRGLLGESPMAAGQMLTALDFYLGPVDEIAVIGRADDPETGEVLAHLRGRFRPNSVLAFHDPARGEPEVELLKNKPMVDGRPTVYVCRDFACQAPLVGVEVIRRSFAG